MRYINRRVLPFPSGSLGRCCKLFTLLQPRPLLAHIIILKQFANSVRGTARNFLWLNYYCAKKTKAIPSHSVISTETNEVSEAEKSQNKNTLFKRFFDFACGFAQNDRR